MGRAAHRRRHTPSGAFEDGSALRTRAMAHSEVTCLRANKTPATQSGGTPPGKKSPVLVWCQYWRGERGRPFASRKPRSPSPQPHAVPWHQLLMRDGHRTSGRREVTMAASPSQERTTRRQRLRERRQMAFQRMVAGLEAWQVTGVSAWIILPLRDDQPVEFLAEATEMPPCPWRRALCAEARAMSCIPLCSLAIPLRSVWRPFGTWRGPWKPCGSTSAVQPPDGLCWEEQSPRGTRRERGE